MVRRLVTKNFVNAKNFIGKQAEERRLELQKARQNFQQNSFVVNSPPIVYYQQIYNGYTCTCHAMEKPTIPEVTKHSVSSNLTNYSDVSKLSSPTEVSFSTIMKSPMFSTMATEEHDDEEDLLLDDDETTEAETTPLFSNLFHKGTDCGICFRTGFTPLLNPIGRHFVALTTHNYSEISGMVIDKVATPNYFKKHVDDGFVSFKFYVPKFFKSVKYRAYNNTKELDIKLSYGPNELTVENLRENSGRRIEVKVIDCSFTHVFIEFDLGVLVYANFPQFGLSKDYTSFFNLQSVTIEIPATVCNPRINDIIYVPDWDKLWAVYDIQPFYDSPKQELLIKSSVQGRVIQTIEAQTLLKRLKQL